MVSLLLVLHNKLDHWWRNLHMNWRTLVSKRLLNRRLNSRERETQQIPIDEFLNFGLERVIILYRMPYMPDMPDMISTYGMRVICDRTKQRVIELMKWRLGKG